MKKLYCKHDCLHYDDYPCCQTCEDKKVCADVCTYCLLTKPKDRRTNPCNLLFKEGKK